MSAERTLYRPPVRATHFDDDTWLEPEEYAYNGGTRRCRARCKDGKLRILRIGIPDTFFTIPVKGGGFVSINTDNGKSVVIYSR